MHYNLCDTIADIVQNSIEANATLVEVELTETENNLTVYIRDNGCGMSAEDVKKAQNPFYTDGVKHPKRRIGLGIPFLIQTVTATQGEFKIDSELGKGTTVYMMFNLQNIDTPPLGDVSGMFRQLLLLTNQNSDYELKISRKKKTATAENQYDLSRNQLKEVLGDLENGKNLMLLGDFLKSQELSDQNRRSLGFNAFANINMGKMTLEELRAIRSSVKSELLKRDSEGKSVQVIVGMGTCGIAAGAKATLDAFIKEMDAKGLAGSTIIRQTGCMEHCSSEPTVEVIVPDMPTVIYGNVDVATAKQIVEEHIIGKKLLDNKIIDRL